VSFTTERLSEFKVKQQPLPGCLSTVESIHQVLIELNRLEVEATGNSHHNLMDVFRKTVDQQVALAQDPDRQGYRRKPLSLPEERTISKKWSDRLLFFRS
jgi:DTW domain-containing protein YfiP